MCKVKNIVIEEYVNIDETFKSIKNIKVGSMTLNDLFGDNLKVIEKALEERKELLKWKDSQQDLIKGKDEYIAKLLDDNKKAKENFVEMVTAKDKLNAEINNEKEELIAEQHRLFDLAKEQEEELKDLREFAKVLCKMKIVDSNHKIYGIDENDIALIKKVVEKYGN